MNTNEKLAALREVISAKKVDGYILPMADEFLSEYVPANAARLEWLTGFTGSAGLAIILPEKAAFFTDGRYTLQAAQQVPDAYERYNAAELAPEAWLAREAGEGAKIGIDPRLLSTQSFNKYKEYAADKHIELVPLVPNFVDNLWKDRPAAPTEPAFIHELQFAGETSQSKIARVLDVLAARKVDAVILTVPESINWLLNIRGRDVEFTPVLQAYALLFSTGIMHLYINRKKLPAEVIALLGEKVILHASDALPHDIQELAWAKKRVMIDAVESPYWFSQIASENGAKVIFAPDPCITLKARKSDREIEGIKHAHVIDGVAMVKFLHWLDENIEQGATVTELDASERLHAFRDEGEGFICPSFASIAGSGANGAIVHYRAIEKSNRVLKKGELFLLDSGGQYMFGTTDITRTLAVGEPSAEQKDRFTRVLKGHIALASARFPKGTSGGQLDAFARQFLWNAGLDYDHGTGHGVGYALSVHEGPQRIGKRGGDVALEAGMVLSNEPGYYKKGEYGIRIESLVIVEPSAQLSPEGREFFEFGTLTCVPIDQKLMDITLLTATECAWINHYHAWVRETLSPLLLEEVRSWLHAACAPIMPRSVDMA